MFLKLGSNPLRLGRLVPRTAQRADITIDNTTDSCTARGMTAFRRMVDAIEHAADVLDRPWPDRARLLRSVLATSLVVRADGASLVDGRSDRQPSLQAIAKGDYLCMGVTTLPGDTTYRAGIAKSLFPLSQRVRTHAKYRRCLIRPQVAHLAPGSFADVAAKVEGPYGVVCSPQRQDRRPTESNSAKRCSKCAKSACYARFAA